MSAELFTSENIGNVLNKVTSVARQYYDDDDDGGLIGLIGMLVVGGIFLLLLLTIVPAILGLLLTLLTGGLGGLGTALNIPLATLNANNVTGRKKRAAGTGIPSGFNFQRALRTLEKAYKAYSQMK